jgi:hypothetical protein
MLKFHLKLGFIIIFCGLLASACSHSGLQSKNDEPGMSSVPDCRANYTKEGNWFAGRVYKTWVRYENLDFKKGFDAALTAIQAHRDRGTSTIISSDRQSGVIRAEMASEAEQQTLVPVEIRLVSEKTSVTIHISSNASGASDPVKFCKFFGQFEKEVKKTKASPPLKQIAVPPKKPLEQGKEVAPAAPPPAPPPKSVSSPSPPPRTVHHRTQVLWAYVNLRAGPGTNYRVIGQVRRGVSLEILEVNGGWLHSRLEGGMEGWISKAATSEGHKPPPPPSPVPRATPLLKSKSPM